MISSAAVESRPAKQAISPAPAVRFALLGGDAALAATVRGALAKPLGFEPDVRSYPGWMTHAETRGALVEEFKGASGELFLLPVDFEFGLFEKEAVGQATAELRRNAPQLETHYDGPSATHPLLVEALTAAAWKSFGDQPPRPERLGVLLAASGQSDAAARADVYALMRLLWERLGVARGEVAFLRHMQPFLPDALERLSAEPLDWIVVPAMTERGERFAHLQAILEDHQRAAKETTFRLVEPPIGHEALVHCLAQRALALWRTKRQTEVTRVRSPKREQLSAAVRIGADHRSGIAADVRDAAELRAILPEQVLDASATFVKVTWHGYASGTYTDPVALDALLEAIPGRTILLEGHTSSRNAAGRVEWDWETEAREHRTWIRAQENDYFERTGIADVMRRHRAVYVNVTEEYWDGRCRPAGGDDCLAELSGFIPEIIFENAGAPLISFARFKGPTRLSLANLFGLIPEPLRARWHGPNITYLARVCCQVAKAYGSVLDLYGIVESVNGAVRWDRQGLYRSRWGNYDVISSPGLATISRGVAAADALAARLQGQDPRRSAYYDVVESELGIPRSALDLDLPQDWVRRFA